MKNKSKVRQQPHQRIRNPFIMVLIRSRPNRTFKDKRREESSRRNKKIEDVN
jgi:hypothetical protein